MIYFIVVLSHGKLDLDFFFMVVQGFIKHLFVSMSVTQNLSVSVFVHKCLMMLNDVEYTTFKMFVTQMSTYLFVISFE